MLNVFGTIVLRKYIQKNIVMVSYFYMHLTQSCYFDKTKNTLILLCLQSTIETKKYINFIVSTVNLWNKKIH